MVLGVGARDTFWSGEIRSVVAIATKVTEKSHQFMAAYIQETTKGTIAVTSDRAGAASGCGCS